MFGLTILFVTLTFILLVIGYVIGWFFAVPLWGMGIAFAFVIIINVVTYWYSDKIVLKLYKAKPSENEKLHEMVRKIAQNAKLPVPRVYEVPKDVPNAFATGRNPRNAVIAVTKGLLKLDDDEIEAVIAHEMGHIRNRDTLLAMMGATIAGAISYLAQIGYWSMFMGGGQRRGGEGALIGFILVVIFAPIAALLIRFAISRKREFKADEVGALLTKKPKSLASALRRISELAHHNPIKGSSATSHMWIVNPFKGDWFSNLFRTHPPIQKRVERLERMDLKELE